MYEANPLGWVVEQAGGRAADPRFGQRVGSQRGDPVRRREDGSGQPGHVDPPDVAVAPRLAEAEAGALLQHVESFAEDELVDLLGVGRRRSTDRQNGRRRLHRRGLDIQRRRRQAFELGRSELLVRERGARIERVHARVP